MKIARLRLNYGCFFVSFIYFSMCYCGPTPGVEWHQFFIEYDPLTTAEMVRCPVLILHGDQDKHVPVEHANIIAEAIRRGENQDVTVHIFPGYDHHSIHGGIGHAKEEAKKKEKEKKSLNEIAPFPPDVLGVISDWIVTKLTL